MVDDAATRMPAIRRICVIWRRTQVYWPATAAQREHSRTELATPRHKLNCLSALRYNFRGYAADNRGLIPDIGGMA